MASLVNQKIEVFNPLLETPTLEQRISCAAYISARGALGSGIAAKKPLMFPHTKFTENDVENAAAKLLTRLHIETLKALPPEATQRISKALDEYLSLAVGN